MNAYELADWLDWWFDSPIEGVDMAAKMLRMQADEIKALREQLNEAQL